MKRISLDRYWFLFPSVVAARLLGTLALGVIYLADKITPFLWKIVWWATEVKPLSLWILSFVLPMSWQKKFVTWYLPR